MNYREWALNSDLNLEDVHLEEPDYNPNDYLPGHQPLLGAMCPDWNSSSEWADLIALGYVGVLANTVPIEDKEHAYSTLTYVDIDGPSLCRALRRAQDLGDSKAVGRLEVFGEQWHRQAELAEQFLAAIGEEW